MRSAWPRSRFEISIEGNQGRRKRRCDEETWKSNMALDKGWSASARPAGTLAARSRKLTHEWLTGRDIDAG
jgi:hypothetical protein